jgi:hypothetical protein
MLMGDEVNALVELAINAKGVIFKADPLRKTVLEEVPRLSPQ